MISRRSVLRSGGLAAAVLAAGAAWRAWDQDVFSAGRGPAFEPWTSWQRGNSDGPLALVRAAILAASPHNTQPWRFWVAADRIDLFGDPARHLGSIDPDRREMMIGLGCALENLVLAARARGYLPRVTPAPDPANGAHAARVDLAAGPAAPTELYRAIPARHTNRGPYDRARGLDTGTLEALAALGRDDGVPVLWYRSEADRRRLGDLVVAATEAIVADHDQARDSARWMRWTWEDIDSRRDGLTVDTQGLPELVRVVARMLPPMSTERSDRYWLQATREVHVPTAPTFGILLVNEARDPVQRLGAGRVFQRMHLWATARGLAMQPLSQVSERADREATAGHTPRFGSALRGLVGDSRWEAIQMFRIGRPTRKAPASPRRPVNDVLTGGA